jgi:hypothetical protein
MYEFRWHKEIASFSVRILIALTTPHDIVCIGCVSEPDPQIWLEGIYMPEHVGVEVYQSVARPECNAE